MQRIKVIFFGVRGSVASPDRRNIRYGGHTACIAIRYRRCWLICDAGTGIRPLGEKLAKGRESIFLLLSHLHWDHLFGLPFFKPLYQKGRKIFLAGPGAGSRSFRQSIGQIVRPPFFPIAPTRWPADIRWRTLVENRLRIGPIRLEVKKVSHRSEKTFGFGLVFPGGKRILYVTDHELKPSNRSFLKWIEGADLLIHDSQYDRRSYRARQGWGHSAFERVVEIALQAGVKRLCLFHHDPAAGDALLEKRLRWCRKRVAKSKGKLKCYLAQEGSQLLI